jgi:hypothetical protein
MKARPLCSSPVTVYLFVHWLQPKQSGIVPEPAGTESLM